MLYSHILRIPTPLESDSQGVAFGRIVDDLTQVDISLMASFVADKIDLA